MNTSFGSLAEYLLETLKSSMRGLLVRRVLAVPLDAPEEKTHAIVQPLLDYCKEFCEHLDCVGARDTASIQPYYYDYALVIAEDTTLFTDSSYTACVGIAHGIKAGGSLLVININNTASNKNYALNQKMSKWINLLTKQENLSMRMHDIHDSCIIILFRKS